MSLIIFPLSKIVLLINRPHIKDSGDVDINAKDASLKFIVNLGNDENIINNFKNF